MKNLSLFSYFNICCLLLLMTIGASAQPDYDFRNPVRISGVQNQVGSVYRFSNVRVGVDALVTVNAITGNLKIDTLDSKRGYMEAFEPQISPPTTAGSGYVEFKIDFVATGTAVPMVMLEVPATTIDIDGAIEMGGGDSLFEYDMISMNPMGSYVNYQMVGNNIDVTYPSGFGMGKNNDAQLYPPLSSAVDTNARNVMFSVVNSNVSTVTFRLGIDNRHNGSWAFGEEKRLKSIYFKKFTFSSSFLSTNPLLKFSGISKDKNVNLQWELCANNNIQKVIVERANTPTTFSVISEMNLSSEKQINCSQFGFADNAASASILYYRLKIVGINGQVSYSNILAFRFGSGLKPFKVYPSVVQSSATISIKTENPGTGLLQLIDYSGRVMFEQKISLQDGENNIPVKLGSLYAGNYLAVLKADHKIYNQKIIKE